MIEFFAGDRRFCDGLSRRRFLQIGALGMGGLALPDLLRARSQAEENGSARRPRSVIVVCLQGGPSHIDMYDMKPNAPAEYRGEYRPMRTRVPGIDICDQMPLQAGIMDKLAIVRGVRFIENNHDLSEVYTGLPRPAQRPAFGSIISRLSPLRTEMPRYVALSPNFYERPLYVGAAHHPFVMKGPAVESLDLAQDLTLDRMQDRRQLLHAFDTLRRDIDSRGEMAGHDVFTRQALNLIGSPRVRDAFDISLEPEGVRRLYGDPRASYRYGNGNERWDSHAFLLARRLAEAGVPIVTLSMGSWDHHGGVIAIFPGVRQLLPLLDRSIHALVTDIHQRGLERDIAVLVWGEFGRTPKINGGAGRDHWPDAGCALFAGGGLKTGQVIGATDARAEMPRGTNISAQNIVATVYDLLGVDPTQTLIDHTGRPLTLLDDPKPVADLY